jgi:hypothetical protein
MLETGDLNVGGDTLEMDIRKVGGLGLDFIGSW